MRDDDFRESSNIEDRRDSSGGFGGLGGGGGNLGGFSGGGGLGLIGFILSILPIRGKFGFIIIVGVLLFMMFGGGSMLQSPSSSSNQGYQHEAAGGLESDNSRDSSEDREAKRVARVLGSTEDFWGNFFRSNGEQYQQPTLVLFRGSTPSPCGTASGATGPFYCPGDQKVYLDLGFFEELSSNLGASGDFAEAYVIAHEIGHHVQNQTGILPQAHRAMGRGGQDRGAESIAVRIELQADCLAGMWAKSAISSLEAGDVEEGIRAAQAVGDDRLQKNSQGYAVPDSFTHGTSEQRARWFNVGMRATDFNQCDTFRARDL